MDRREELMSPTESSWASLAAVEGGSSKHGVPIGRIIGKHAGKLEIESDQTRRYGESPTFGFTREIHRHMDKAIT
jgi:hypothetical protein